MIIFIAFTRKVDAHLLALTYLMHNDAPVCMPATPGSPDIHSAWWWRRIEQLDDFHSAAWRYGQQRAALAYELARRLYRNQDLPIYLGLTGTEHTLVNALLGVSDLNIVMAARATDRSALRPGWSDPAPWHWNLRASDNSLKDAFLRYIHQQREKHGIRKPIARPGQKARRAAWAWPELMDLVHFKLKQPVTGTDRESLRKARRAANIAATRLARGIRAELAGAESIGHAAETKQQFRHLLLFS